MSHDKLKRLTVFLRLAEAPYIGRSSINCEMALIFYRMMRKG